LRNAGAWRFFEEDPVLEWFVEHRGLVFQFLSIFTFGILLGVSSAYVILFVLRRISRRASTPLAQAVLLQWRGPLRVLLPLLAVHLLLPLSLVSQAVLAPLRHLLSLGIIAAVAWLAARGTRILEELALSSYRIEEEDNLRARKIHTQIQVFKKIILFSITLVALAAMLMTFDRVRQLGTAILASAGIVGVVVGLAAQRTVGTLIAGLQIAITQPIRVDDVVVVENEWGHIEEITLTHVTVRIWDLRRLILPITYFMERPFQNWTRVTADVLGTVFIHVDYSVPVQAIRDALYGIVKESGCWDGRAWGLQVTNATERTVELRALVSASNASDLWNLRCEVREKLLDFIQKNHPEGLPKVRTVLDRQGGGRKSLHGGVHE
jgi:small-conductance mechanosensitive channel